MAASLPVLGTRGKRSDAALECGGTWWPATGSWLWLFLTVEASGLNKAAGNAAAVSFDRGRRGSGRFP
jgi:hypothetical protein